MEADRSGLYIDGEFVDTIDGATLRSLNPATGEFLADISEAGAADIDRAVLAARTAYRPWSKAPGSDRAEALHALAHLLQERTREFALLESLDTGRPIAQTREVDLPLAVAHLTYNGDWAGHLDLAGYGDAPRGRGVSAQILPWTSPLLMLTRQVAPALAAGSTVVVKPAAPASLTAIAFADLCMEAALPPGVINIVTGDSDTGTLLVRHPDVDVVGFTGPARIGTALQRAVAGTRKTIAVVPHGPCVALVDVGSDPSQVADEIIAGLIRGQDPAGWNGVRIIVHASLVDALREALHDHVRLLRVGDPLDSATQIGPVITAERLDHLRAFTQRCDDLWVAEGEDPIGGWWQRPGSVSLPALGEEYLGPILAVQSFQTQTEAIALTESGGPGVRLGVWSADPAATLAASRLVRAQAIWSGAINLMEPAAPTGLQGGRTAFAPYLRSEVM